MQLIIFGMHRSGTSMVARLLNMMGAYFGPEGISTDPSDENVKGFWERRDVRKINDAVLASIDCDWDRISQFEIGRIPEDSVAEYKKKFSRIVLDMDANRPWLLKEPRLCLLYPLIKDVLELPICIHVFRNPLEVAFSLNTRNSIPVPAGIALWEKYLRASLASTQSDVNISVQHSSLVQSPHETMVTLYDQLVDKGVQGLRLPSQGEVSSFIDQKLYRERAPGMDLEQYLNVPQLRLYESVQSGDCFNAGVSGSGAVSASALLELESYEKHNELHQQSIDSQEELRTNLNLKQKELDQKEEEIAKIFNLLDYLIGDLKKFSDSLNWRFWRSFNSLGYLIRRKPVPVSERNRLRRSIVLLDKMSKDKKSHPHADSEAAEAEKG